MKTPSPPGTRSSCPRFLLPILLSLALSLSLACRKSPSPASSLPPPSIPSGSVAAADASLVPSSITVGSPADFTLRIVHPSGATVEVPPFVDDPRVIVLGSSAPSTVPLSDSLSLTTCRYSLTSLVVTNENLLAPSSPIVVTLPDASTAEIPFPFANLEVRTTLVGSDTPLNPSITTLRHWPLPLRRWFLLALYAFLVLALLAVAVWLLVKYLCLPVAARLAEPPTPPHVIALAALDALRRQLDAPEPPPPEPFYVALSAIVRTYLEARFSLHAPTATTEEFLHADATRQTLSVAHRHLLADFLEKSDLVKFARYAPSSTAMSGAVSSAVTLVTETAPAPDPASPASPASPAP